ncbi:MAG TPA: YbjN domain-containing protein [Pyrinomonadaceae bacterium]
MLDKVGLKYALHSTAQGFPYAGFRVEVEPGRVLSLTAMVRGRALDLRANGVISLPCSEDDLRRINDVNVEWGLGRIYYDEEQSAYHLATAIYLKDGSAESYEISNTLKNLYSAASHLQRYPDCFTPAASFSALAEEEQPSFETFFADQYYSFPQSPDAASLEDVQGALDKLGYAFTSAQDGRVLVQRFFREGTLEFYVELFKLDDRFLFMCARYSHQVVVTNSAQTLRKVQALNAMLSIGSIALRGEPTRLFYQLCLPLAWTKVNASLLEWMIDRAAEVMAAVEREFWPPVC